MKTNSYTEIDFLILAAKLSAEVKGVESFVLQEVEYGQYKFSASSKRAAIRWITVSSGLLNIAIEGLSGRSESFVTKREARQLTIKMNRRIQEDIVHFREDALIDKVFMGIWCDSHNHIYKLMRLAMERVVGTGKREALTRLSGILSDAIDATRFELYEIDNLLFNNQRVLMVTDMCVAGMDLFGENPLFRKYSIYQKATREQDRFKMKNYCSSYSSYKMCVSDLRNSGAVIDTRESERGEDE